MNAKEASDWGSPEVAELRSKAEQHIHAGKARPALTASEADARALVHELQVHQVELEMQNEELHRAQVAAEEASQKYGDLFDFAPVGYFLWDHEGRILEINLAGAALLGLDRGLAVHKRFGQFVAAEHRATFADFCHRVSLADTKHTCELKILKDGQAVDVLVEGIAAQDRQGPRRLCRAAVIDISQQKRADELAVANRALQAEIAARKQAEQSLRESETRFRTMANAIPQLAWIAKADGYLFWYNQRWYDYTGSTPEQMKGWGWQRVHDPEVLPGVLEQWRRSIATGEPFDMIFPLRGADGVFRPFLTRVMPLKDEQGRVRQWFGTNTDVSEQKRVEEALRQSEEQLTMHFENTPLAVIEWGADFRLARWSAEAERIFGWPAEEVLGKRMDEFRWICDEDVGQLAKVSAGLLDGTCPRSVSCNRNYRKDGTIIHCEWYNSSLFDDSGKLRSILSLVLDVTKRKRDEEERRMAEEFLRLANESRGKEDLVRAAVTFFQEKSGCEAVGIRLKEGDDYPYYETRGFPQEFVLMEDGLCARDSTGAVLRDSAGYPLCECMCGNVIGGRFDPSKPFFTARGSFWTNCTTELLASTTEADRQARTRNRCNGEGYESVALIALCAGEDRLGLLQLNDRRKGRFTAEGIALWERLAGYLAVALAKTLAEEALQATAQHLDAHISNSPLAIVEFDATFCITRWSEEAQRLFGWTTDEVAGKAIADLRWVHEDDVDAIRQVTSDMIAGRRPRNTHANRNYRKDGSVVHCEWYNSAIYDRAGRLTSILSLVLDVTDRKRAEEEVRSLAEFPKENPNPILRASGDGSVLYANQPAVRLLEAMGWQAGQPLPEELLRPARRVLEGGGQRDFDLLCPMGRTFSFAVAPSSRAGQVNLYARDITERQQADRVLQTTLQRFYVVLSSMYAAVLLVTDEGRVEFANPAFCAAFGLADAPADLVGLNAPDMIEKIKNAYLHPDEAVARIQEVVDRGEPVRGEELAMHDGRTCLRDFVPLNVQGKSYGRLWIHTDITERKQAEAALFEAKAAAEAANLAKSQFLANMSHELRTPMNAILGMIDVALPKAVDPTVDDCLKTAKGSADLLLTLLNDLLDSAKIESGKLELESAPFSLRRMLDQITRVLALRASEKGVLFSCQMPAEVPDALIGDQVRLRQVLSNLADNALKFTERGKVEVSVRVREGLGIANWGLGEHKQRARPQSASLTPNPQSVIPISDSQSPIPPVTLEFAVRDTGIGIPPCDLERIFQPFSQADASTTRRFGGTGLGLSICSSLVTLMGGQMGVESEMGRGSTFSFTVRLPLAAELPPEPEPPLDVPAAARSKLRILLAEDNPANQKLATYILQDRGHTVEVAGDGQQAIAMARQNPYDVILMDVQMPGMDGLETTAAIRAREAEGKRTPIIAMTAYAMRSDRQRCLAGGMDGYLSKPIDANEMLAIVESLATGTAAVAAPPAPMEALRPPAAAVFDPEVALKRCLNKPALLREMIAYFFKDVDSLLPQIRAALEQGDLVAVGHLGHRLKGTLIHLGAAAAREAARGVERFHRGDGQPAEAEEAVRALERECEALRLALTEYQATTSPRQGDQ